MYTVMVTMVGGVGVWRDMQSTSGMLRLIEELANGDHGEYVAITIVTQE